VLCFLSALNAQVLGERKKNEETMKKKTRSKNRNKKKTERGVQCPFCKNFWGCYCLR